MNITGIKWVSSTHKIVSYQGVSVKESYFEDFLVTDCSACLSLESQGSLDITKCSFKDIINLKTVITSGVGAAIYSAKTISNVLINQTCFIECGSTHGHTFSCYGTTQSSFNSSVIMTQRLLGNHSSFFADFRQTDASEINITKTNQELFYFARSSISNARFISCIDMEVNYISFNSNRYAFYVQTLTSCSNVVIRNVTGLTSVIYAQSGNVVESLFLDKIGDATISAQSIVVKELSFINSEIINQKGSAKVESTKQVSEAEVWFRRDKRDCFLASAECSAGSQNQRQPLRTAVLMFSLVLFN